ncbi:MAG: type I methionyl aminopeptidase [Desulfobulbaceae bacterium]|uniref:Methionine aminopeptidase n=1 Tax=Candidatus Desulfobia pelagia TaxID=2841692 RepID=A0A8J6NFW4_9BACT|nr:type I methionyl aminopeptidase [Candidatus Desulfobia pelagia]
MTAILLKSPEEIEIMREANQIVAQALALVRKNIVQGISTLQLDKLAEKFIREQKAVPAFKGYRGFPGSLCVSINEQVVHGIPSKKVKLREGDIVSIDCGVKYKGYYGDAAITVPVGTIDQDTEKLIAVTRESLQKAILQVQSGNKVTDISTAVQEYVEKNGFSVVRQFVGHGIGQNLHEPPEIPNYVRKERSPKLMPGMVLAIEPMVNAGTADVRILKDGWTVVTQDKKPSAHFEHSVAVTENGPLVLSSGTED